MLLYIPQKCATPTSIPMPLTNKSCQYTPLSSVASAACDTIITLSVMYYLRPANIRYDHIFIQPWKLHCFRYSRENFIKKLLLVFVEMGLFTL